ncbi:MAG: DUF935 domain-containing protein [Ignavibacteriaceae bacterium]|nr:DUF935 domain-containing protein [Ignavibacteriaceae bacterium]
MKKNSKISLTSEFVTREKMELYERIFTTLPDPDKILSENNYDYNILRDLLSDAHLIATIQQRKMQVMQMGWEVYTDEGEGTELKQKVIDILKSLPLGDIMNNILDAIFYGFAVNEIEWILKGNELIPKNVIGKPQEWFIFNRKNELLLRKKVRGSYIFEEGERLPEYKFIIAQYKPSYTNPYGEKVLSRCYWPVTFKRAGIEFWQLMIERFGMPYLIGRYQSGATQAEKDALLDDLGEMVKDSISVFEEGKQIEIKESPSYDVGDLYRNLVKFHNTEISKAVLTVTLTTEMESSGSYKAAEIHRGMLNYLGVTDKKLVEKSLNKLLEYYVRLNYGDAVPPKVKLNKKEAIVDDSAERDLKLRKMGIKFSKEYYKKRYNLSEEDFQI